MMHLMLVHHSRLVNGFFTDKGFTKLSSRRAQSGFDINKLATEDRALRASVLRLWGDDCQPESMHLDDIIRFNESIDQALAESWPFSACESIRPAIYFLGCLDLTCATRCRPSK